MPNDFSENEEIMIPDQLPLLPVRDVVVYPYMILPLFVGREASIRAVNEALAKDRLIFLAAQREIADENPAPESIYPVGTIAMIMRMRKLPDGRVKILVQGLMKGTAVDFVQEKPFFVAKVKQIKEKIASREQVEVEAEEPIIDKSKYKGLVLVVDDESMIRILVSRQLELAGFKTIAVESGDKAIEELEKNDFDFVLMDKNMNIDNSPDKNFRNCGIEATRTIRDGGVFRKFRNYKDIPIFCHVS